MVRCGLPTRTALPNFRSRTDRLAPTRWRGPERSWSAPPNRRTVAARPGRSVAHNAITDGVRLMRPRRGYRVLDLGRSRAVHRRRARLRRSRYVRRRPHRRCERLHDMSVILVASSVLADLQPASVDRARMGRAPGHRQRHDVCGSFHGTLGGVAG
jgi:hypothetical protein